jgi:hypothetical protein
MAQGQGWWGGSKPGRLRAPRPIHLPRPRLFWFGAPARAPSLPLPGSPPPPCRIGALSGSIVLWFAALSDLESLSRFGGVSDTTMEIAFSWPRPVPFGVVS